MIIFYGSYHWFPKTVGFRRDYCRRCDAETLAVAVRTFDAFHLFWIPILPYGMWSRWVCSGCGAHPHSLWHTRRGFKWLAVAFLAVLAVAGWLIEPGSEAGPVTVWLLRVGAPFAILLTVLSIIRRPEEIRFRDRLAEVEPHAGHECPLCGGILAIGTATACSSCGARHRPLRAGR